MKRQGNKVDSQLSHIFAAYQHYYFKDYSNESADQNMTEMSIDCIYLRFLV